jgi:molybdopterin synthase sulfur carrier subunit
MIISNNFYNRNNLEKKVFEMVIVEFLGPIGEESLELEAKTLHDVAVQLREIDTISAWLDKCAVAVNDEMTNDLSKVLKSGDKVSILPPVCGG